MADYRTSLRMKGFRPMTPARLEKLRTQREPGDVEIVRDPREADGWRLHRYGETA